MCRKCFGKVVDGIQVHIQMSGNKPPDKETIEAIEAMVKVAKNYVQMKKIEKLNPK